MNLKALRQMMIKCLFAGLGTVVGGTCGSFFFGPWTFSQFAFAFAGALIAVRLWDDSQKV